MRDLRPEFELETEERMQDIMARVSRLLRAPDCPLCGIAAGERIELYVPAARQRLWSLELRLEVTATERGTSFRGTYARHPHVWVACVAILALSIVALIGVFTLALAEWTMGHGAVALFAVPPLGVACGVTYRLAFASQRLAAAEMDELRAFIEDAILSTVPRPSGVRHRVPESPVECARGVRVRAR
jgi:hypothetical protein